jgi:hypothetical protein
MSTLLELLDAVSFDNAGNFSLLAIKDIRALLAHLGVDLTTLPSPPSSSDQLDPEAYHDFVLHSLASAIDPSSPCICEQQVEWERERRRAAEEEEGEGEGEGEVERVTLSRVESRRAHVLAILAQKVAELLEGMKRTEKAEDAMECEREGEREGESDPDSRPTAIALEMRLWEEGVTVVDKASLEKAKRLRVEEAAEAVLDASFSLDQAVGSEVLRWTQGKSRSEGSVDFKAGRIGRA